MHRYSRGILDLLYRPLFMVSSAMALQLGGIWAHADHIHKNKRKQNAPSMTFAYSMR